MKVLNLVTNERSPFYQDQVHILEEMGVYQTTVSPRRVGSDPFGTYGTRSLVDYLPLLTDTLKESLKKYDVLHANYGLTAPFALAQLRRPVVISFWGSDLIGHYGWFNKSCARYGDEVIVMSKEMAKRFDEDVHIIPHGVDIHMFRPIDQPEAVADIGWDPSSKHILFPYPGRRDVKNHDLAVAVADRVDETLDDRVELHVLNGVEHDRVPLYMNAADVMIMTSKREGSPNTIKEALACNLPIISTDVGDVAERLSNVDLSYVCNEEDEFVERISSVIERGGRSNGRDHVRHLSLENMGERILDVYEQALS
ncbi:glycosyltransferase [Natrialbaceae archaeon A-CW3]